MSSCRDSRVLIFCSNSFLTLSGTRLRAFGVTFWTILSTLILPSSSLTMSRHSRRTSSLQPHSVSRSLNRSFNLKSETKRKWIHNFCQGNKIDFDKCIKSNLALGVMVRKIAHTLHDLLVELLFDRQLLLKSFLEFNLQKKKQFLLSFFVQYKYWKIKMFGKCLCKNNCFDVWIVTRSTHNATFSIEQLLFSCTKFVTSFQLVQQSGNILYFISGH